MTIIYATSGDREPSTILFFNHPHPPLSHFSWPLLHLYLCQLTSKPKPPEQQQQAHESKFNRKERRTTPRWAVAALEQPSRGPMACLGFEETELRLGLPGGGTE